MKLKIYKEDCFVVERENKFGHSFKRYFTTEEGLFEHLTLYTDRLNQYDITLSGELSEKILKFFNYRQ